MLIHSCYLTAWICNPFCWVSFIHTDSPIYFTECYLCERGLLNRSKDCRYRLEWLHGEAGKWIDMKKLNQLPWAYETTFFLSVESSMRSLLDPCFSLSHWWCEGSQEEPFTLVSCAAYSVVQKLWERDGYMSWYLDSFKKFCIQLWYQSICYGEFNISQTFLDWSHPH